MFTDRRLPHQHQRVNVADDLTAVVRVRKRRCRNSRVDDLVERRRAPARQYREADRGGAVQSRHRLRLRHRTSV